MPAGPRGGHLLSMDVLPTTLARYQLELDRLDAHLSCQGIAPFVSLLEYDPWLGVQWISAYIQYEWQKGTLGLSNVGNLLSGAKRVIVQMQGRGKGKHRWKFELSLLLRGGSSALVGGGFLRSSGGRWRAS